MGKPKEDSGTWLMTYGDLVTLLLVFFVLLYTMTPGVEEESFNAFLSYFQKNASFFSYNTSVNNNLENNLNSAQTNSLLQERLEKWEEMAEFAEHIALIEGVKIEATADGFLVTMNDSVAFESGSSELLPEARNILDRVAHSITNGHWLIEVQGHTDNVPISGGIYQTNWHLGAARAVSVVQYLQSHSNIPPQNFKASSFGEFKPVADNNTAEGRRQNRRVEIYLLEDQTVHPIYTQVETISSQAALKTEQ